MKIEIIKGTRLATNNYLVTDNKSCVLVEASAKYEDIEKALNGRNLSAVLLTHAHWDHFISLSEILSKQNCKLCCSQIAKDTLDKGYITRGGLDLSQKIDLNKCEIVKDGDELMFGALKISVIETPGHTKGGLCFLCENTLFSGDTLFFHACGRCDFEGGSEDDMRKSLQRLFALDEKTMVMPGHDRSTTIAEEKKYFEGDL